MKKTHWKKLTNPNYLGAYSIEDNKDLILTIKNVVNEMVIGTDGKKEECVVCYWQENEKPMILNATNLKMITKLSGSPYIEDWGGRKVEIGIEKVRAFGEVVEALRVRNYKVTDKTYKCEECGSTISGAGKLSAEQMAAYTTSKYGKALCAKCATRAANSVKEETDGAESE